MTHLRKSAQTCSNEHGHIYRHRTRLADQRSLVLKVFYKDLQEIRLRIQAVTDLRQNIGSYTLTMVDKKGVQRRWPTTRKARRSLDGTLRDDRNFRVEPFEFPVVRSPGNYEVNFFAHYDPRLQLETSLMVYIPYGIFTLREVEPLAERGDELAPPLLELPAKASKANEIRDDPTAMEDAWIESSARLPEVDDDESGVMK